MDPVKVEKRIRELQRLLRTAAEDLRDNEAARDRGIMRRIGEILREGDNLAAQYPDQHLGWSISAASLETRLSRPTLYKLLREETEDSSHDLKKVTNAGLARIHLGYGPGGHEAVDAEFWRRNPTLAGWHQAIMHLWSEQHRQWEAGNPDHDFLDLGPMEPPPGVAELTSAYRRAGERIANLPGRPEENHQ